MKYGFLLDMDGDTMETDILGGVGLGYRTILVLSGGTAREDLANYAYSPDLILEDVSKIPENLQFRKRTGKAWGEPEGASPESVLQTI